jgi:hypothetical protein
MVIAQVCVRLRESGIHGVDSYRQRLRDNEKDQVRLQDFLCEGYVIQHPAFFQCYHMAGKHKMATDDIQAELERLRAENAALKQKRTGAVSMKVSEKGAVSVYGLGRFPVTLYQEQWTKLLALADDIKTFIEENRDKLKVKGE